MPTASIIVRAQWDPEADVWVAQSDDLPGLVTEADTLEHLTQKLETMVPELIELNGFGADEGIPEVPMHIYAQHTSRVRVTAA